MIKPRNKPRKDMIGQKFGLLTVVKLSKQSDWGDWRYKCRCDCGNSTEAGGANLRKGAVSSCGCLRFKPIKAGTAFGMLSVIRKQGLDPNGATKYLCRCECGNTKIIRGYCLTRGDSKSCGCKVGKHLYKHGQSGTPLYNRIKGMRRYAMKLSAKGSYTLAQVDKKLALQDYRCYYCGVDIRSGYHLDHKIPLIRGGSNSIQNIVGSCPPCNLKKSTLTSEEFKRKTRNEGK